LLWFFKRKRSRFGHKRRTTEKQNEEQNCKGNPNSGNSHIHTVPFDKSTSQLQKKYYQGQVDVLKKLYSGSFNRLATQFPSILQS
jgi:hypothetical protein